MLVDVETAVQDLSIAIMEQQSSCSQLEQQLQALQADLEEQEKSLNQQKLDLGICQGKVEVYQAFLSPVEEHISNLRGLASGSGGNGDRSPIIAELKQTLMALGEAPEALSL